MGRSFAKWRYRSHQSLKSEHSLGREGPFPSGLEVGVERWDGFFPLSSLFLPLDELSDPGLRGDFLPSIPFSLGEWWFPFEAPVGASFASSTTRSWSDFSPSLTSWSRFIFLCSGDPARFAARSLAACSPGLKELLCNKKFIQFIFDCHVGDVLAVAALCLPTPIIILLGIKRWFW